MGDQGAAGQGRVRYGRVPARVLLDGEADGWHYTVVDRHGDEEHVPLRGPGVRWQGPRGRRREDPEPPWWRRHLDETAEALRGHIGRALTDRTFAELGSEAEITWFAVAEPARWEGLVTLREADPARFPGKVAPFVVTFEPGRGALLPDAHLLFSTLAADAWTTLAAVSERCATPAPKESFLCGYTGHRSVRVGRGSLDVSTQRGDDGAERIAEIHASREAGWSGNPELRPRLDGIDLLDEPAGDVVALFRDLGHEVVSWGRHGFRLPQAGLSLHRGAEEPSERFTGVSLAVPASLASLYLRG
ncbi:hypothetical protein [Actinomadura sp. 21ATH]|uniref:hypothetical protein n=1 Tax=Actinomadura sp. 21ATH TaxID=1735444 RepID=UPI0035C1AD12